MNQSKNLLNSRIISFFFNQLIIKTRLPGILWMVVSFVAYPLCLVSDRLFGDKENKKKEKGYILVVEGEKAK